MVRQAFVTDSFKGLRLPTQGCGQLGFETIERRIAAVLLPLQDSADELLASSGSACGGLLLDP